MNRILRILPAASLGLLVAVAAHTLPGTYPGDGDLDDAVGKLARHRPLNPGGRYFAFFSRCSRRNAIVRGHACCVALRFAPSRLSWARRKPCPAPS